MREIILGKSKLWASEQFIKDYEKAENNFAKALFFGCKKEELDIREKRKKTKDSNLRWAWVLVSKTRKMVWVDSITMKAYKADGYDTTYMEIKNYTFLRWCRGMDL